MQFDDYGSGSFTPPFVKTVKDLREINIQSYPKTFLDNRANQIYICAKTKYPGIGEWKNTALQTVSCLIWSV